MLRARLEQERAHNAAVLQTVYWSLGVLATLAIGLIGFGWLANFRVYERDKEALTKTLEGQLNIGFASMQETISSALNELRATTTRSVEQMRVEIDSVVRSAVDARVAALHEEIAHAASVTETLRLDHELIKVDCSFRFNQPGAGFSAALAAIHIARDLKRPWVIESVLNDLEKRIRSMDGVFGSDISRLTATLEHLDGVSETQRERVLAALRTVRKL